MGSVYYLCIWCYMRLRYWRLLVDPFHSSLSLTAMFPHVPFFIKLFRNLVSCPDPVSWLYTFSTSLLHNSWAAAKTLLCVCCTQHLGPHITAFMVHIKAVPTRSTCGYSPHSFNARRSWISCTSTTCIGGISYPCHSSLHLCARARKTNSLRDVSTLSCVWPVRYAGLLVTWRAELLTYFRIDCCRRFKSPLFISLFVSSR